MYGKIPPQAKDLEKAILGAAMLERGAIDIISEILPTEAFYIEAHQRVYAAILRLSARSEAIDTLTVPEELKKSGELEMVGGPYYITTLTNDVTSAANIEAHSRIVLQKFIQRELIRISGEIISEAYEDTTDVFDLLDKAESEIFAVGQNHIHSDYTTISAVMVEVQKDIEMLQENDSEITGVPSGFPDIDGVTHGWQDTDLIIIGARPSVGKTAFALNLARNAGVPVGLFELEMSRKQLGKRMVAAESEISLNKLMTGRMDSQEMTRFVKYGVYPVGNTKLYVDDRAGINMFAIRSKARKMVNKHGVQLIIIDYLQLIESVGNTGNREQEISKISRGLKQLAKDLSVPVIALSQLSRDSDGAEPMLKHLRESGAIEQDADVVIFLWGPSKADIERDLGLAFIRYWKIAKHRNGALDEGALPFYPDIQKFKPSNAPGRPGPAPLQDGNWKPVNIHRHDPEYNREEEEGPF